MTPKSAAMIPSGAAALQEFKISGQRLHLPVAGQDVDGDVDLPAGFVRQRHGMPQAFLVKIGGGGSHAVGLARQVHRVCPKEQRRLQPFPIPGGGQDFQPGRSSLRLLSPIPGKRAAAITRQPFYQPYMPIPYFLQILSCSLRGLAVIGDAGVEIGGEEIAAGHLLILGGINGRLDGHQAGIVDGARRQTGALIGIVGFVGDFQPSI